MTVIALLPPMTVAREQAMIDRYKFGDAPLYIMPLDEAADVLAHHRYQSCSETQRPVWEIHTQMWERGEMDNARYMLRESQRVGMLIKKAFNTDANLQLAREMMYDEEKNRVWFEIRKRQDECLKRMREEGDLSPDIGEILEDDIRELERIGIDRWMLGCYERTADYFFAVQEDEKAFRYLSRAYELSLLTGYQTQTSHLAGRIGKYHERSGDYESAGEAYDQCLESARITGDRYAIARALSFMASMEKKQGNYIDSERLYNQALENCDPGEGPFCEVSILKNLAELHYSFGYMDRAGYLTQWVILLCERALEKSTVKNNTLEKHSIQFYLSGSLSLLARLQNRAGETNMAVSTIRRALDIAEGFADKYYYSGLEKLAGDLLLADGDLRRASHHYDRALKIIRKLGNSGREAEYLVSAAGLRIREGRFREAEEILRDTEQTARSGGLWRTLVETEFLRGESAATQDHPDEAIAHYERAVAVFDHTCPGISFEENKHDLAEKIHLLYSRILEIQSARGETGDSLLFWSEKSLHRPCGGVADSTGRLEEMIRGCISDRAWLPESSFIIRYIVTGDRLIGIGIDSKGSVHHDATIQIEELNEKIVRFFELCNPGETAYHPGRGQLEELSMKLYRLLIEPFSASLGNKETLCVITSGPLDRLPFTALLTPEGDFLCEHVQVLMAPSVLHLYLANISCASIDKSYTFSSPLLVGPPEITPEIRRLFPDLIDLPYAADEIDQIDKLVGGGIRLAGAEATPLSLLEHIEQADLVHIATHTVHFPIYNGEKAFILSPPGDGTSHVESCLLFETSIRELDLENVKLAVLSTCESIPGADRETGTGPGLAGAFFKAGAETVIATIWPIDDRNASKVMTSVYEEILGGAMNATEALTEIQRRIIEEDRKSGNQLLRIHMWAPYIPVSSLGKPQASYRR